MSFIKFIKEHTPWPVRLMSRRFRRLPALVKDKRRSTKEVFTEVYAENIWGQRKPYADKDYPFYSGPGSGEEAGSPYADCVNAFIEAHGVRSVIDLGCGDFRVGRQIARPAVDYMGIDIVEPLIYANQKRFANDHIQFRCLDIISDELPKGDLCLVREVLQHLSNAQISAILLKLRAFQWVIVTESEPGPLGLFRPNKDKPHGGDSRMLWNSGVVLNAPPFSLPNVTLLLDLPLAHNGAAKGYRICSFLIHNYRRDAVAMPGRFDEIDLLTL